MYLHVPAYFGVNTGDSGAFMHPVLPAKASAKGKQPQNDRSWAENTTRWGVSPLQYSAIFCSNCSLTPEMARERPANAPYRSMPRRDWSPCGRKRPSCDSLRLLAITCDYLRLYRYRPGLKHLQFWVFRRPWRRPFIHLPRRLVPPSCPAVARQGRKFQRRRKPGEGGSSLCPRPFSHCKMSKNRRAGAAHCPYYHVLVGLQYLFFDAFTADHANYAESEPGRIRAGPFSASSAVRSRKVLLF